MKSVLIVSRDISLKSDGGTLVCIRNERLFKKLGYNVTRFEIPIPSNVTHLKNILLKKSYGETSKLKNQFVSELKNQYNLIFFDGSMYGGFLELAKKLNNKCICFYHNVEADYYQQKYLSSHRITDKVMVRYIRYNEHKSTVNADGIIALTLRDSMNLGKLYQRESDIILPTSFPNRNIKLLYQQYHEDDEPYLLFVGSNFFANQEGLDNYINEIAPFISLKTKIVGNISDAFHSYGNSYPNIEFLGMVEALEPYYINACAVIAPILSGSGLKTKTAEALSYGKTVIGYEEAFTGIDVQAFPNSTLLAHDSKDFIAKIKSLDVSKRYNEESFSLFQKDLSDDRLLLPLTEFIQNICD